MRAMSPGATLRELQQAQAGLKKARELLKQAKDNPRSLPAVFDAGWEGLTQAHRLMASIPREAIDDTQTSRVARKRATMRFAAPALPAPNRFRVGMANMQGRRLRSSCAGRLKQMTCSAALHRAAVASPAVRSRPRGAGRA